MTIFFTPNNVFLSQNIENSFFSNMTVWILKDLSYLWKEFFWYKTLIWDSNNGEYIIDILVWVPVWYNPTYQNSVEPKTLHNKTIKSEENIEMTIKEMLWM